MNNKITYQKKTFRPCYEIRFTHEDGNIQVMLFNTEFEADLMKQWLIKRTEELNNGQQNINPK